MPSMVWGVDILPNLGLCVEILRIAEGECGDLPGGEGGIAPCGAFEEVPALDC